MLCVLLFPGKLITCWNMSYYATTYRVAISSTTSSVRDVHDTDKQRIRS